MAIQSLKVIVSVALLAYLLSEIDVGRVGELVLRASPASLAALALLAVARIFVGGWRFSLVLAPFLRVPVLTLVRHCFVGATFNQLLPTAIGGDAVRMLLLAREARLTRSEAAVYIVAERWLGIVALLLMGAAAAPFVALPRGLAALVYALPVACLLASAVVVVLGGRSWSTRFAALDRAASALRQVARSPRAILGGLIGSLAFQLMGVMTSWVVAVALSLDVSLVVFLALVPLVYLATVLPFSFGGVGLREAAFVTLLGAVGVQEEASLAISLGTYATLVLPGLVGALLWLRDPARPAVRLGPVPEAATAMPRRRG